jgi:hypothetical protein
MTTYILNEGVLNDDEILLSDENKVFKGNYIAIVKRWEFQNSWSNRLKVLKFRNEKRLNAFLQKYYPEFNY